MLDEGSGLCSTADNDCGTPLALPYFISFQLVGCFVFLNLVVAVTPRDPPRTLLQPSWKLP